jgi:pimeloyl-ACP methyl ester carboxylesterase
VDIEPFYFGPSGARLFGCYQPPRLGQRRNRGVILCYPMGHEYVAAHRAYRQLATRLSKTGFHVLRFDFYGCGDSAGDCGDGHISQWLDDIGTAITEMRKRSGLAKFCLVGLRLGGSLAALAGARRNDIDALALWDPVIDGGAYIDEASGAHREMMRQYYPQEDGPANDEPIREVLGFALAHHLLGELVEVNLLAIRKKPAERILMIESDRAAAWQRLHEHFRVLGVECQLQQVPGPQLWKEDMNRVLVPGAILDTIVSWLNGVSP